MTTAAQSRSLQSNHAHTGSPGPGSTLGLPEPVGFWALVGSRDSVPSIALIGILPSVYQPLRARASWNWSSGSLLAKKAWKAVTPPCLRHLRSTRRWAKARETGPEPDQSKGQGSGPLPETLGMDRGSKDEAEVCSPQTGPGNSMLRRVSSWPLFLCPPPRSSWKRALFSLPSHPTPQDPGAQKYLLPAGDNLVGRVSKRRLMIGQMLTLVQPIGKNC